MYYPNELYHYGILGMRWGIRRYQPYPKGHKGGKEIGKAKQSASKPGFFQKRKIKKQQKQRLENLQKAREAAAKKRVHDKDKARVLKEGTASEVLKYRKELSNDELRSALNRIKMTNELASYASNELTSSWDKIDKVMAKVAKVNAWGKTGVDSVKIANDVMKMLDDLSKSLDKDRQQNDRRQRGQNQGQGGST